MIEEKVKIMKQNEKDEGIVVLGCKYVQCRKANSYRDILN